MFATLCALPLLFARGASADNPKLDFHLHNETGFTITELYVGPTTADEWGEDILGQDVLPTGQSGDITFSPKADETKWDIKVVNKDGDCYTWTGYDLSKITDMTLYYKDGECTAETKNGDEPAE